MKKVGFLEIRQRLYRRRNHGGLKQDSGRHYLVITKYILFNIYLDSRLDTFSI